MIAEGTDSYLPYNRLLKDISELDILTYYFGVTMVPTVINSPLRKDNKPSFALFMGDDSIIRYKDFSTGERGHITNLLMNYWNCSFSEMVHKLNKDFKQIKGKVQSKKIISQRNKCPKSSKLQVKIREWKDYDLEYWNSFGISLPWLKFGKVYPISHIFITKEGTEYSFPADKYAYAYVEKKDKKVTLKIYQPYNTTAKWINKHDNSVWDLWEQLPASGEKLIITSSRKDALTIWENTGIPACSLQSESYFPKKHVVEELQKRFTKIFLLYDNDYANPNNPGRTYGYNLAQTFNLHQIEIPEEHRSKDASDFVKHYGREALNQLLLTLTS